MQLKKDKKQLEVKLQETNNKERELRDKNKELDICKSNLKAVMKKNIDLKKNSLV